MVKHVRTAYEVGNFCAFYCGLDYIVGWPTDNSGSLEGLYYMFSCFTDHSGSL